MARNTKPVDAGKNLKLALFKSLLVPVLLLVFFVAAPSWLNARLRSQFITAVNASPRFTLDERQKRLDKIMRVDFQQVCTDPPPGGEKLQAALQRSGVAARFQRLRWGLYLSALLVFGLAGAVGLIFNLNEKAGRSQADLIRSYRLVWKITMVMALAKVFLLIPLLAYGTFEFSVLLSDHYLPKLLVMIVLGGLFALWTSATVLLKKCLWSSRNPCPGK